jgi:hypothetical protein
MVPYYQYNDLMMKKLQVFQIFFKNHPNQVFGQEMRAKNYTVGKPVSSRCPFLSLQDFILNPLMAKQRGFLFGLKIQKG